MIDELLKNGRQADIGAPASVTTVGSTWRNRGRWQKRVTTKRNAVDFPFGPRSSHTGIAAKVTPPFTKDLFGREYCAGMRQGAFLTLRLDRVDMARAPSGSRRPGKEGGDRSQMWYPSDMDI